MNNSQICVIILGLHYNGYSISRNLRANGYEVVGIDYTRSVGSFSKDINFYKVDYPLSKDSFETTLKKIINKFSNKCTKFVLFPTSDFWVYSLGCLDSSIISNFIKAYEDSKKVLSLLNKSTELNLSENILTRPKILDFNSALNKIQEGSSVCVKNSFKYTVKNGAIEELKNLEKYRFIEVKDKETLFQINEECYKNEIPIIFQELITSFSSDMRTIGICSVNGKLLGLVYGQKIRGRPFRYGDCIAGKLEETPKWALSIAEEFVSEYKYTGIAEIELIEKDGKLNLLEINPRSWSWIGTTFYSEAPLPLILLEALCSSNTNKEQTKDIKINNSDIFFVKFLEDFQFFYIWSMFDKYKKKIKETTSTMDILKSKKVFIVDFNFSDPISLIYSFLDSLKIFLKSFISAIKNDD